MRKTVIFNGFGRIGRAIFRQLFFFDNVTIIGINDSKATLEQLIYFIKHDSLYGEFPAKIDFSRDNRCIRINNDDIIFTNADSPKDIPHILEADYIIDSTGNSEHIFYYDKNVKKAIVTFPIHNIDSLYVFGLTTKDIKFLPKVISTSICDVVAISPIIEMINSYFPIDSLFVTTMHPVLSYQQTLDSFIDKDDYQLGRAYSCSLIPKSTSADYQIKKIFPLLADRVYISTVRVPTLSVSMADFNVVLSVKTNEKEILKLFQSFSNDVALINNESLVSIDFIKDEHSFVFNTKGLRLLKDKYLHFNIWYNNEWGYASRVTNLIKLLSEN